MKSARPRGFLSARFRRSYLASLREYRFFYDDIAEIGSPATARHVFYFVPGINGTPGQMRFLLPSISRVFGERVHLRALHLPEFSARTPIWEKYTRGAVDRRIARLRADLRDLLGRYERFAVLCSSNGFYDFAAAACAFPAGEIESRVQLVWGACAPHQFRPSPWEKVFYPLNGFEHAGHGWWAYPNNNALTAFNPETSTSYDWTDGTRRRLFKTDLESRFRCLGLQWAYISPGQLGEAATHAATQVTRPWGGTTQALVATRDGYWQGTPQDEIERQIRRFIPHVHCLFKPASHLWVVNPTNVTEIMLRLKRRLRALGAAPTRPRPHPPVNGHTAPPALVPLLERPLFDPSRP